MKSILIPSLLLAFITVLPQATLAATPAPETLKSGNQVYTEVCSACHDTGVASAPKFGDKEAWAPLISEGQAVLTSHAWVGVRAMPAKGGNPELKLLEFARGVAWMTRAAGSDWKDPDAKTMRAITKEAEKRLDFSIREAQAMKKELQRSYLTRP